MNEIKMPWFKRGDVDATIGVFFDGFTKIIVGVGVLTGIMKMSNEMVFGKLVSAIGLTAFLLHSLCKKAWKEDRQCGIDCPSRWNQRGYLFCMALCAAGSCLQPDRRCHLCVEGGNQCKYYLFGIDYYMCLYHQIYHSKDTQ